MNGNVAVSTYKKQNGNSCTPIPCWFPMCGNLRNLEVSILFFFLETSRKQPHFIPKFPKVETYMNVTVFIEGNNRNLGNIKLLRS